MSSSYIFNAFSRLLRKNTQQVYVAMQVSLLMFQTSIRAATQPDVPKVLPKPTQSPIPPNYEIILVEVALTNI